MRQLCWAISLLGLALAEPGSAAPDRPPNVLLIAIDDLNDWVGCLGGHPQARTPNINRLAERGVLFTNAQCQAPICGPSRASLLSGRYPHSTGLYQQPGKPPIYEDRENFGGQLLPERFEAAGYETLAAGKITHGIPQGKVFQITGSAGNSGPKPPRDRRLNFTPPEIPYTGTQTDWGAFPERDEQMPDHGTAGWAEKRLAEPRAEPFFLAVGFHRPHVPFYVPQRWFELFPIDEISLPPVRAGDDLQGVSEIGRAIHELPKYPDLKFLRAEDDLQFRRCVQAYLACIAFVDHQVGRVLMALERSPHADNTVVVLFSDHGYHLGEKDRVSKHSLWEESARVPLIIAAPGVDGDRRCAKPVGLIDLYPTLLELCQLPARAENEGQSLVPLLRDPGADWRFAILTTYTIGNHSLRSERHRYLRYEDGSEELYDMQADPNGWNNLADSAESTKLLERFLTGLPDAEAPYHRSNRARPINAWFQQHLEKNGVK